MISAISLKELYYGAYKSQQATANLAKVRYIENAFDIVIAAAALTHNLTLVTNNEKHFRRVEGLKLANWTKP